jgi:hypothetical protein
MRRLSTLLIIILFFNVAGLAQDNEIKGFVTKLKSEHSTSDVILLKKAFREAHKTYLKHYKAYSETVDIFQYGNFDCLSGTIFFSSLLDNLGFEYKIFETNYHIFLIANTSKGEALIETTDRNSGFVISKSEIEERLNTYKYNNFNSSSLYLSKIAIFKEVSREQLKGLVFFNKAVCEFLKHD